jgi:hypothetical protein
MLGYVVGLLLDKEDIRTTQEARKLFRKTQNLECVWTARFEGGI